MIKISSFDPFANLQRVIQEFGEEKAQVKVKSLTFEREFEFEYKDVGEISDRFLINSGQHSFSFWLLFTVGIGLSLLISLFGKFAAAHSILLRIGQTLYVCGLILYITSFKKSWHIYISDKNDNVLTHLKLTSQNHELVTQAIDTIKSKAQNVQERTAADPFHEEQAAFEHDYYDFENMVKTTDRFYENEVIGFEKSFFRESAYSIKYSQLSKKVYHGKLGNNVSGAVLTLATLLISIIGGFIFSFGSIFGLFPSMNLVYIFCALGALFLISLPLNLIKREVIGLYDKNGNILYWTYVNKTNKSKVEEIIKFMQSKISP